MIWKADLKLKKKKIVLLIYLAKINACEDNLKPPFLYLNCQNLNKKCSEYTKPTDAGLTMNYNAPIVQFMEKFSRWSGKGKEHASKQSVPNAVLRTKNN